jgi:hypothetical protein
MKVINFLFENRDLIYLAVVILVGVIFGFKYTPKQLIQTLLGILAEEIMIAEQRYPEPGMGDMKMRYVLQQVQLRYKVLFKRLGEQFIKDQINKIIETTKKTNIK